MEIKLERNIIFRLIEAVLVFLLCMLLCDEVQAAQKYAFVQKSVKMNALSETVVELENADKAVIGSINPDVAIVINVSGNQIVIRAVGKGSAKIQAEYEGNTAICKVKVMPTALTVKNEEILLYKDSYEKASIGAKTKGVEKKILYENSDNSVAVVDEKGKVKAAGIGETTVTLKANGIKEFVKIKVAPTSTKIETQGKQERIVSVSGNYYMVVNTTALLNANVSGRKPKVKWKSSDKKTISIDSQGTIVAKKIGSADISATANKVTDTKKIIVVNDKSEIPQEEPSDEPEEPENPQEPGDDPESVNPATIVEVEKTITVTPIDGISSDFFRGVDASEVIALEQSRVNFKNKAGEVQDVFKTLSESGVNYIRLRVWNNPYDEAGNGYGGGNCDLDKAVIMGKRATENGMKVLIDFHYSDFWADPGKYTAPKEWNGIIYAQKKNELYDFTYNSLEKLINSGVDVGMVQVGNEVNNGVAGQAFWDDRGGDSEKADKLLAKGCEAVHAIALKYKKDIPAIIHYTDFKRKGDYDPIKTYMKYLDEYQVEYDGIALSYYPTMHGDFEDLEYAINEISASGKIAFVAETAYPFTDIEGDGHSNDMNTGISGYPVSVQGQSSMLRDVCSHTFSAGGCGVFYWGAVWIPVGKNKSENKYLWEKYGSGWATSYAALYDSDAKNYYGGNSRENTALFNYDGTPLASLETFKLIK